MIKDIAPFAGKRGAAFGAPLTLLVVYFFLEYVRPQDTLLPFLKLIRPSMIITLVIFIIFLKNEKSVLKDRLVIFVILFIAEIAISVAYATNTYYVWRMFFGMSIILFTVIFVMPVICDNKEKLRHFFQYWVGIHVILALYSITHGGHGPGGFLLDENDLALTLNMVLPFSLYLSMSDQLTNTRRNIYRIISLLIIIGVGVTSSRGGFLGLVAVFFLMWLLSENRMKTLVKVVLVAALLSFPVYKMIPEQYITEMSTISDTEDGTRQARVYFWEIAWDMFLHNPILGVGANNYPWNVAKYQMMRPDFDLDTVALLGGRPAHSLYFTLIPELGLVGIALFLLILRQIAIKLRYVYRATVNTDAHEMALFAKALLVSTGAYLVTGAFISVLYYPSFWYLTGFVVTLHRITINNYKIDEQDDDGAKSNPRNRNGRARRRRNNTGATRRFTP